MIKLIQALRQLKTQDARQLFWMSLIAEVRGDAEIEAIGDGTLLRDILKWIAEHPEEFKALVEFILSLFV